MNNNQEDFYNILEINKSASQDDIKKAYRKLALKWHPDKNKSSEATDMFKKINEAYDTLSDPEKRQIYDQYGKDGLNSRGMKFEPGNAFDIFSQVFGNQEFFGMAGMPNIFPGLHMFHEQQNKEQFDIIWVEHLTLKEVYTGKQITRELVRKKICESCNGTGYSDKIEHTCKQCNGNKIIQQQTRMGPMISISQIQCPSCRGKGNDGSNNVCMSCNCSKLQIKRDTITISIPSGFIDNDVLGFNNMGNFNPITKHTGKLLVKVVLQNNTNFLRGVTINNKLTIDKYDLVMQMEITLAEALCGLTKTFKNPNDNEITINISDVIKNGEIYIIENEGLPSKENKQGNIYVIFNVTFPYVSKERKEQLWKILVGSNYIEPEKCKFNLRKIDL
jgi:DnaJ-class molecular chaperone